MPRAIMLALRRQDSRHVPEWDRDRGPRRGAAALELANPSACRQARQRHENSERGWRLNVEHMEWIEERARRCHGQQAGTEPDEEG
jgi:hypothetical protein